MATGPRYSVKWRRRREGKTNYGKRLALLRSGKPRFVVRSSGKRFIAQYMTYDEKGDRVVAYAESNELRALGWNGALSNMTAAYLTGYLASVKAKGKVREAVLDIGLISPTKGSKVYAALKGALDAGMEIPASEEVFPSEERLKGAHLKKDMSGDFDNVLKKVQDYKPGPKKIKKAPVKRTAVSKSAAPKHAKTEPATEKKSSALEELLAKRRQEREKKEGD